MKKVMLIGSVLVAASAVQADIINLVGDGSGYDTTEAQAVSWRSTGVDKGTLDADDAFGTSGSWFAGDATANIKNNKTAGGYTTQDNSPVWVSNVVRVATTAIANANVLTYDDPTLAIGETVADVAIGAAFGADMGNAGDWGDLLTFEITEDTPDQFRLGIMSGAISASSGWTPTGLRISYEGGTAVEVTGLEVALGMVFFDIDTTGLSSGTFTIEGQNRANSQGATLTGLTFDVIPEPATIGMLGFGALSLVVMRRRMRS